MRVILALLVLLALPAGASAQTPTVTTGAAQSITQTTATVTGTIDPNGESTSYHFEYGTTTAYGLSTPSATVDGDANVAVQAPLTGLTADTTYHYRLVAGGVEGADRTFRTAANPRPPGVSTGAARDVGTDHATLTGSVDPNTAATTYHFQYGRSASYGARTAARSVGSGDGAVAVTFALAGLRPHTSYHFRLVATNAAGTTSGRDRSFTTPRALTGVTIALDPARVMWSRPVTIRGLVSGTGAGGTPLALEAQPWPFSGPFTQIATRNAASNGTYSFTIGALFISTRLRVVTRTQIVVMSPVATARSVLRVGARRRGRRLQGTIWPAVPKGRASLQRRTRGGHWVRVARHRVRAFGSERSRYRFTLPRRSRTFTYRVAVLARDGGAHMTGVSRAVRLRGTRHR